MKKEYLKFHSRRVSYLPKLFGKRLGMREFSSVSYKSDGDKNAEEDTRTEEELLLKIEERMNKSLEGFATSEELLAIRESQKGALANEEILVLRSMADDKTGVMSILTRQGLAMERLKGQLSKQTEDMSVRAQVSKWMEKNKESIQKIKSRGKADLEELEIQFRSNNPMLPANSLGGSVYLPKPEFAPGIVDIIRQQPTFWDYVKKGATSSAAYVWINKRNPLGAAAFIAPGVYKPNISFTIETEISNAKKIAANEKMAIELLDDIDGFTSWVEDELMYQVKQKASVTLMNGVASSTNPAGIQTLSTPFAFAALGLKTASPNAWDVIRAGVAQLRYNNFSGAVTTFMNPVDYANMVMTKANNQGQTFIPPVTGSTIVEDNNIPVGHIQMAILDYYKILIYKPFSMTWGLENDDFTKNLRTVIAEMRIHQFFSENHTGAFLYDTIANGVISLT